MKFISFLLICLCALITLRCDDNTFNPKAPGLQDRIVVFAVLDATKGVQMVRIAKSFDPPTTNPNDYTGSKEISTASISVFEDRTKSTIVFHDTTITDSDNTKHKVWVNSELPLADAINYTLNVHADGYPSVSAKIKFPNKPFLFARPFNYSSGVKAVEMGSSSPGTFAPVKGFLFRLWIVGTKTVDGKSVDVHCEVPVEIKYIDGKESWIYPSASRDLSVVFPLSNILRAQELVEINEKATGVHAVLTGYTFEQNFYNYYYAVRGFGDPLTVRQDQPDISNITNGYGVFGAMNADSVKYKVTDLTLF